MTTAPTHNGPHVDQGIFRNVMGSFTSGVAVITTKHGGKRFGVTASAVSSLSMDPPMLLICLNRQLATADAITGARVFAVNILAEDQGELAAQFATRHPDKFRGVPVVEEELEVPILTNALAHLECRVAKRIDVATHAVFMAEVQSAQSKPGKPLAYFRSGFGRFSKAANDDVYRRLREHVLARTTDSGEILTLEGTAAELGIDRTHIYYALQELRSEGLILAAGESGYRVAPLTAANV